VRQHVHGLRRLAHEVEDAVCFLPERHRVRLQGVDDVRELDRVADEEHREVVADEIPVAVLRVELDGESPRVARDFGRIPAADHGRKADGERGLLAGLLEEPGTRVPRRRLVPDLARRHEITVRHEPAGVDHPLRDPLAIEVADLLEEMIILERGGTAVADGPLRLVIGDRMALPGGQCLIVVVRLLRHRAAPFRK
jgi:hypothetical protein